MKLGPTTNPGLHVVILYLVVISGFLAVAYDNRHKLWRKSREGLNISCFVFRDTNRNAVYDLDDRPYAGLSITMSRPEGGAVARRSNIAGFANFEMSFDDERADVSRPGEHTVQASVPPGWSITSANARQTLDFRELVDAPAGMIVEETCDPIGVAPELTLSGTLAPADGARVIAGSRLRAVSPAGERSEVQLSEDGVFVLDVTPGRWRLELAMQAGTVSREISVGAYAVLVSSPNPDRDERPPLPQPVRAGFDGLTPSDTLYEVPNGYLGLNWTNLIATHHKFYRGDGYINATVSSEYMAYNSSGHPANVWSEQPFDFVGTHLGVAWWHGEGHDIVIRGWRGDRIVYTDRVRARTAGPVYFDADYRAVTRVDFLSEGYGQVVLDDVDFRLGG